MKTINLNRANDAEAHFEQEMMSNGWAVSKRGWPDFICYRGAEVIFIEVKPTSTSSLSRPQRVVMEILQKHGLTCLRWDTQNGFTDLDGNSLSALGFEHRTPLERETLSDFMLRMKTEANIR